MSSPVPPLDRLRELVYRYDRAQDLDMQRSILGDLWVAVRALLGAEGVPTRGLPELELAYQAIAEARQRLATARNHGDDLVRQCPGTIAAITAAMFAMERVQRAAALPAAPPPYSLAAVEKAIESLHCECEGGYKERGLVAPGCPRHDVGVDLIGVLEHQAGSAPPEAGSREHIPERDEPNFVRSCTCGADIGSHAPHVAGCHLEKI
jgi:hypothetical protein